MAAKTHKTASAAQTTPYFKSVRLVSRATRGSPSSVVVFYCTPEVSEARSVNYAEVADVRMPASILIWMGSPARNFSLNAKFISRSAAEADLMFDQVNFLKSWTTANTNGIGAGNTITPLTAASATSSHLAPVNKPATPGLTNTTVQSQDGAPQTYSGTLFNNGTPQVVELNGYGGQFRNIPCVITGLNITYPADVDYIQNSSNVWVPVMQDINISLKEAREVFGKNTGGIDSFNLRKFREGTLQYW